MKIRLLPALALALGFSIACGGGTETTTVTPPPPPAPVAADGSIGVPECDDYIKKMEACIASADPTTKAAMESGLKSTRDAWSQAAAIPQTKATLASSCSAMLASVPTTCGTGATGATTPAPGTPVAGTPATNPDGTPVVAGTPTTTTTTTTTVVTTTDDTKKTEAIPKASSTGAKAPARETRPPADMSRSRDGATRSGDGKSGDGDKKEEGMGRSRPK